MKKTISIILLFSFVLTMLCACGTDSSSKTEITQQESSPTQNENTDQGENAVTQEHINFILSREVFMSGMETFYKSMISDYDKVLDVKMTFADLMNNTYFESLKWEYLSNEDDMIIVSFYGILNYTADRIPVSASFAWQNSAKAPIINAFIFGKNDDGSYNEISADTIQEAYGYEDYSMALFACDATFSMMLASALIDVPENNQGQTAPTNPTIDQTTPNQNNVSEPNDVADYQYSYSEDYKNGVIESTQEFVFFDFIKEYFEGNADIDYDSFNDIQGGFSIPGEAEECAVTVFKINGEHYAMQISDPQIPQVYLVMPDNTLQIVWSAGTNEDDWFEYYESKGMGEES